MFLRFYALQFQRLYGETHASILCGASERYLLESCFSPYRLHPAAPLALLKFYSKEAHLPEWLPPRGMYSSTPSDVREMQMFGPQTVSSGQQQANVKEQHFQSHSTRFQQTTGVSHSPHQTQLSRANTIGGLPSQHPQAALQLLYQRSAALGVMSSRCVTPQQQRNLFQYSGSLSRGTAALDLNANNLDRIPSAGLPNAGRNKRTHVPVS